MTFGTWTSRRLTDDGRAGGTVDGVGMLKTSYLSIYDGAWSM